MKTLQATIVAEFPKGGISSGDVRALQTSSGTLYVEHRVSADAPWRTCDLTSEIAAKIVTCLRSSIDKTNEELEMCRAEQGKARAGYVSVQGLSVMVARGEITEDTHLAICRRMGSL